MTSYVALLRGINVGGRNMVAMSELRKCIEALGLLGVKTLLQSGNVVFQSQIRSSQELESLLTKAIESCFHLRTEVFVRTLNKWERIVAANPYPEAAQSDPSHLVVIFLREAPKVADVETVRAAVAGREVFQAQGNHIYVVYPDGIGDSKLPKTAGWTQLTSHGTARNWNTVLKLANLSRARKT